MDKRYCKNDLTIWTDFVKGDRAAFAYLYNKYIQELYNYGFKICGDEELVKDAIQEIFVSIYLNKHKLSQPKSVKFYLMLALKRAVIKKIVQKRKSIFHDDFEPFFEPDLSIESSVVNQEEIEEQKTQVLQLLESLPSKQKEAVYLRFVEGLDYEEIAEILEVNIESARKQIYRAVKSMRDQLNKNY